MSNRRKRSDNSTSKQLSLIDEQPELEPGGLDMSLRLKAALSEALKRCKHSRYQVCAQVSEMTGRDLSKTMLDQYTAESKEEYRFPAELLPAFCIATGSFQPLEVLLEASGCSLVTGQERDDLELVRIEKKIKRLEEKATELRRRRGA